MIDGLVVLSGVEMAILIAVVVFAVVIASNMMSPRRRRRRRWLGDDDGLEIAFGVPRGRRRDNDRDDDGG